MKKFYTLFAALTISAIAFSQSKDWNISNEEFNALDTISATTTINGLTIYAAADKIVEIDGNKKTLDDVSYTHRLKLGGNGNFAEDGSPLSRVLSFDVEGSGTITVLSMSSSGKEDRTLKIAAGTKDNELGEIQSLGASLTSQSVEYKGNAEKIHIYSPKSGVNIYRIMFTPSTSTSVKPVVSTANVVSVEYFNIGGLSLGNKLDILPGGIYVELTKYDDGSVSSKKIVKRKN